jgi:nuclear GTP-binding protein
VTLRRKYKIKARVTEHNRKLRREARRNPNRGSKLKKDPGVPNMCPFKEQLVAKMERSRAAIEAHSEQAKQTRRAQARSARGMSPSSSASSDMLALATRAARQAQVHDARERAHLERAILGGSGGGAHGTSGPSASSSSSGRAYVDSSRRAYYREFKKVVAESDVVLEVVDARDPLGYRCEDIERLILRKDASKKIILVLNKVDLVPRENMIAWLKHLRHSLPTVAFKCSTQSQRSNLGQRATPVTEASSSLLQGAECLGADTLLKLLKNYSRSAAGMKTSITVGIIGYPNTGKSSLINSLKRCRAVGVGSTPGFTKTTQLIHLDKHIKLLDSPGIVFSSRDTDAADVMLRNCVRVENIDDPLPPVEIILKRCAKNQLLSLYRIADFDDCHEFLGLVAHKRGRFKRRGVPDIMAAARTVLQDWNSGRIRYFTHPPEQDASVHVGASIVASWAPDFNVDQVFEQGDSAVIAELGSETTSRYVAISGSNPAKADGMLFVDDDGAGDESDDDHGRNAVDDGGDDDDDESDDLARANSFRFQNTPLERNKDGSSGDTVQRINAEEGREEAELNPQINQQRKRAQKQERKARRRQQQRQRQRQDDDSDDDSDDAFDFNAFQADREINDASNVMIDSPDDDDASFDSDDASDFDDDAMLDAM